MQPAEELLVLSVEDILSDPENTRNPASDEELLPLGESMKATGQQQPVTVYLEDGKYRLISGQRRRAAARLVGIPTLKAVLMAKPVGGRLVLGRMAENKARKPLKPVEDVDAVARSKRENPGMSNRVIVVNTGYSEAEVCKCLTVADCPLAYAALAEGMVSSLNDAYTVALAPPDMKQEVIARLKAGEGSHAVAAAVRKARKPRAASAAKPSRRVAVPLPSGTLVQVTGPEMDMDGLIDALQAALNAAKKANREHLDISTFAKVASDKAKAGA